MIKCFRSDTIANEILMTIRANKKSKIEVSLQEPIGVDKEGNELPLTVYLSSRVHIEKYISIGFVYLGSFGNKVRVNWSFLCSFSFSYTAESNTDLSSLFFLSGSSVLGYRSNTFFTLGIIFR